jgi:hypothetical protein
MFMLTREERHRFAEWLAFQAQTNIGLADQLDSLNVFGLGRVNNLARGYRAIYSSRTVDLATACASS